MSNIFEGGASGMSTERVYSTDALNDFVTEIDNGCMYDSYESSTG